MPLDEALARLLAAATPQRRRRESVSTFDAHGRVLAQDVVSALDVPPRDNSSMDGYAVRSADCAAPGAVLPVASAFRPARVGSAARGRHGGAHLHRRADPRRRRCGRDAGRHERTARRGRPGSVRIEIVPAAGQWIRRAGEDVARRRRRAVARRAPHAAGARPGRHRRRWTGCRCAAPARRAVLDRRRARDARRGGARGDEAGRDLQLQPLHPARRCCRRLGCEVNDLGIVPDRRDATSEALRAASPSNDLIVTSGGVSVGEEDHIKAGGAGRGPARPVAIAMKPGKPLAFGRIGDAHLIGLPGNPVSSFVTFLLLVRPFLLHLQGATRVAPRAGRDARRFRLAARRPAPRVPARAAQCRRRARPVRQPELRRADLDGLGRRPDRHPGGPAHQGRRHGAVHSLRSLLG